jgi:glycosyltransferase involved in cell wall biosynthesis
LLSGYPSVISLQGLITKIYESSPSLKYQIVGLFERLTIRKAKHINPKTELSSGFLDSLNYKGEKYKIEASIEKEYWKYDIPPYSQRMFFTGVLIKRKGIFEFMESFIQLKKLYPELEAVILGRGSEHIREELINLCNTNGISDGFEFTGQISFQQMISRYRKGGVFCSASYAENSPNVVMEAMATGLPVVATNVGDVKNIVSEGKSGFIVSKENSDDLAAKVAALLENRELYDSFGKEGRKIATGRWKPEVIAAKHYEMYQQILSENLSGRDDS